MPDSRQRQPQTNIRICGSQPAHKSMPTVVESPAPYSAHELHKLDFVISGGKDIIMPKALENEHKSGLIGTNESA